ncbi:hypothetical protein LRS73_28335 [Methylobacterium currus]|uniref:hypothetical protein n=1 Tax=Methylobacterium currus TaxID=2051553 RepID=UPI001E3F6FC5|nr:hypothetical protein [Methylobacterium currus]UHC16314.1 hypothetical protein LRS73_28335 [Methylobacterium currus]
MEEMLADGEFYGLDPRDFLFLAHVYRACIRPDKRSLEGAVVSLSDRQWSSFVGIRRKFLWHRRNPANLINLLRARRARNETMITEEVLTHFAIPASIIENETKS